MSTGTKKIKEITELPKLKERKADSHKGDYGRVLVVACSRGMIGCGVLATQAAYRAGCGVVTLAIPESQYPLVAAHLLCSLFLPLPETPEGTLSLQARDILLEEHKKYTVLALGPGLGRHPETQTLVLDLIERVERPLVLDADGLNALATDGERLHQSKVEVILTPHAGEMARLLKKSASDVEAQREELSIRLTRHFQGRVTVALKGHQTIVTNGDSLYINPTGNPGMATGGAGDVLTGLIAGLWAQGYSAFEAAQLGVYGHGLAGDFALRNLGPESLLATDLLDYLPHAFLRMRRP